MKRLRSIDPINAVVTRLPFRWFGIRPADAVVYGGRQSRRRITTVTPDSLVIDGHPDFDLFHDPELENSGGKAPENGIVTFLDQDFAGHREFSTNLPVRGIDADKYYAGLRKLFDRVERRTSSRLVVARHPHSQTPDLGKETRQPRNCRWPDLGPRCPKQPGGRPQFCRHRDGGDPEQTLLLIFSREVESAAAWRLANNLALAEVLDRAPAYMEDLDDVSDKRLFENPTAGFDRYLRDYITPDPDRRTKLWPTVAGALQQAGMLERPRRATAETNSKGT